uniref:MADS-box domain-containing protein n=1 Tax=Spongospora subterranea TaxID=70186 RepID=A0A0H5QN89_9EUKA|eukprot:CRZ02836.1 hypothetical protein [Spongospora subterranea]
MGRKKIDIKKIEDKKHRAVTFRKRRIGFLKKATELSKLCDVDVSIVISHRGTETNFGMGDGDDHGLVTTFTSTMDLHEHLQVVKKYRGDIVHYTSDDKQSVTSMIVHNEGASHETIPTTATAVVVASTMPEMAVAVPTNAVVPAFEVLRPIPHRATSPASVPSPTASFDPGRIPYRSYGDEAIPDDGATAVESYY